MGKISYFITTLLFSIFVLMCTIPFVRVFAEDPPVITGVKVETNDTNTATITWTTDKPSDSIVNFGKQPHYGIMRDPGFDKTTHSVTIEDLDASTYYHFRVSSGDALGNQGVSGDYVFYTEGFKDIENIQNVSSEEQQSLVGQAKDVISQITDPEALKLVQDEVTSQAQDLLRPPEVIGLPRAIDITSSEAKIIWATSRDSNSIVRYASEREWDGSTYTQTVAILEDSTKDHEVLLTGLRAATTYHFQVMSEDEFGLSGTGEDVTFTTKSPIPTIEGVQIIKIEEDSATFAWSTDIPAAGMVIFENTATGEIRSEGSPEFLTTQTVRLTNLSLGVTYVATVRAENEQGEPSESEPITFTTVRDEEPPIISRVNNESTLFPGAETKIQTIVTWGTDEPSYCRLFYSQGLAPAEDATEMEANTEPTIDHVRVITEFLPSTVYKFWVMCDDRIGNEVRSEDFVLFTPEKEKSIIDIILENFEGTFGWVKNIGG
jgi:Purple acid Phosphatase, N-terminal domain